MKMSLGMFGAILLLLSGLVNTIPPIGTTLTGLFDGTPVFQIAVGAASIVVALVMFFKRLEA